MRFLAIHAHPDDIEILAAGTLARLAALGHSITIVTMTPGDCGSAEYSADKIAGIRRGEAARAAALIGAEYRCAEFRDLAIFHDDASQRRVTAIVREAEPDVVLTASPIDYLSDHENTSSLVRDACFAASAPNYQGGRSSALTRIPHLYFMDAISGVDREGRPQLADFYVDIAATFEKKREMLACHQSQRAWLRRQHGIDEYLEVMERWTREAGRRAGCEFAEGFRRYKGHPYPQSGVLEEIVAVR